MPHDLFYLQKDNVYVIPILHYKMEMAAYVKLVFDQLKPDCIAVELPENRQDQLLHAASRLPDISLVMTYEPDHSPLYIMSEPCDPLFEALRCASENQLNAYCIDLDVENYPEIHELLPDPYAIHHLSFKLYYELYEKSAASFPPVISNLDQNRENYMARRLKELSLRYERVLFVGGMAHVRSILKCMDQTSFLTLSHVTRERVELCTLTTESCRDALAEWGYLSTYYEKWRHQINEEDLPDRQKIIFQLYKEASDKYIQNTGNQFPGYHLRNLMKFVSRYALIKGQLMPDLFKILSAAKGCVDHHYAYETWEIATHYPYLRNVDNLPELDLSIEDIWGASKKINFHLKSKSRKNSLPSQIKKDSSSFRFRPPSPFSICSYPPEDIAIENFGNFLKKKGTQILTEEESRVIPFSTSIEEGIDTRETIRHWHEKKLYVKTKGKPPAGVGSICVIFDEDKPEEGKIYQEKYPWQTTWIGEHEQESDMAFYATSLAKKVVGPGISRCEYGGFMMSYPPRRMQNVWFDPDYQECRTKSEILLMAAIDYAVKPLIVYVASTPPRSILKSFASRFGKKIIYLPIGQLSPITLNKLRVFHVLDSHDKRQIADEYIF